MIRSWCCALMLVGASAGCSTSHVPEGDAGRAATDAGSPDAGHDAGECTPVIADALYAHACQHGRLGPYTEVLADAIPSAFAADVNTPQHVFEIEFPRDVSNEDGVWYVNYVPPRDGLHMVFAGFEGAEVPLELRHEDGTLVPVAHMEMVEAPSDCGEMTVVQVVDLRQREPYLLVLGPTDEVGTRVFVEHGPTFDHDGLEVSCGL